MTFWKQIENELEIDFLKNVRDFLKLTFWKALELELEIDFLKALEIDFTLEGLL